MNAYLATTHASKGPPRMVNTGTRVYVPHKGWFGRVVEIIPITNGAMYWLQLEGGGTAVFGSRDVRECHIQESPLASVVHMQRSKPRLVVDNTVRAS